MNEQNTAEPKVTAADELTKAKKPTDIQLTEEDLPRVSGGTPLKLDSIQGESEDERHKID